MGMFQLGKIDRPRSRGVFETSQASFDVFEGNLRLDDLIFVHTTPFFLDGGSSLKQKVKFKYDVFKEVLVLAVNGWKLPEIGRLLLHVLKLANTFPKAPKAQYVCDLLLLRPAPPLA